MNGVHYAVLHFFANFTLFAVPGVLLLSLVVLVVSFFFSRHKVPKQILIANAIGSVVFLSIITTASMFNLSGLMDVALVYICTGFIAMVAFLKFASGNISPSKPVSNAAADHR